MRKSPYRPSNRYAPVGFLIILLAVTTLSAADHYLDAAATGTHDGSSWANAWTSLNTISGLSAGDTVYISGGGTGNTRTYPVTVWSPSYPGQWGTVVNGVTYRIGQDAAHRGTAIFDALGGTYWLVQGMSGVTISGDAGDGAMHIKLKDNSVSSLCGNGSNWTNVRISHIDFGQQPTGIDLNPAGTGVEIDHCYFYIRNDTADHCSYAAFNGAGYDTSSFHDNTVYIPRNSASPGIGADGLQWNGSGYSIYGNTIISYASASYAGGQHQDGWQATGSTAHHIKVYGNRFLDIGNYPMFPEPYFGGFSHMRIHDNVCVITYANNTQAIAVSATASVKADDVIVANNLADGYSIPFTFRNPGLFPDPNAWTACFFYNNVSVNGGSSIIDPNVTAASNVSLSAAEGATGFLSYAASSATNDYHLKAAAASLRAQGTNLSSSFTSDKDGQPRPASGAWDIGPYQYIAGASWYLDSGLPAAGTHDGRSWATAWTSLGAVSGVAPGDTVNISGGPSGSTRTYVVNGPYGQLINIGGSAAGRITYRIGQDASHNGTAVFTAHATVNNCEFIVQSSYLDFSGDAGDGQMHFRISQADQPIKALYYGSSGGTDIHISYVDCGPLSYFFSANGVNHFQIDHCSVTINDLGADHAVYASFSGSTWDDNVIDHDTVVIPRNGPGIGADGFQVGGTGYTISNCTVRSYDAAYTGGQHQDGWQSTGGDRFVKIFGNTLIDIANYALYADAYYGGFTDLRIYDNLIVNTDPANFAGTGAAVAVGTDGGYIGTAAGYTPGLNVFTRVIIANNTAVDLNPVVEPFGLNNVTGSSHPTNFVNCQVVNNLGINCQSGIGQQGNTTSTITGNVTLAASAAPANVVSYVTYGGPGNDYHLKSGATSLIGQGTNLSAFFTTDKDGSSRAASGAWDVGAYAYGAAPPVPTVAFTAMASSGSEGTTAVNLPVTLSASSSSTVTVAYAVTGGTASGGGVDYTLASGTLTFNPGTTSRNIALTVVDDAVHESNETIAVTLSGPTNATLGANTVHTRTIIDNDSLPVITTVSPASGGAGTVITITGTDLAGTTSVTIGGTALTGIVATATSVTATVPASGLQGAIVVTTASGTATSAISFNATSGTSHHSHAGGGGGGGCGAGAVAGMLLGFGGALLGRRRQSRRQG